MIDTSLGFTITRILDATPQQIWNAWTDPDEIAEWWHPRGATTPRESVSVNATVGGRYLYTMVSEETGEEIITGGIYREVAPVSRLVFTWGTPDAAADDTPLVTVTIDPADELTQVTFDIRGVDGSKGDNYFYDGWDSALDSLAGHVGQTAIHG